MRGTLKDRGKNITYLQSSLLRRMDSEDATRVVMRAKELVENLPDPASTGETRQGLMLGLIQSGKTVALSTSIALAADNGYRCFIVLTSDNRWLYEQTIERLKGDLQGLEIEGKDQWEGLLFAYNSLSPTGNGLILVSTKNAVILSNLVTMLESLKGSLGGRLPAALVIDDEADQASLDTRASQRVKRPDVDPGRINGLITQIRQQFDTHTYLQVTATPQALFLQDMGLYRPEFTALIEPGKGYIGGNTFFSLEWGRAEELIRYASQTELDDLLDGRNLEAPASLKRAVCTFFVGATIKYLQDKDNQDIPYTDLVYSFLCHISQKKYDHDKAEEAIKAYFKYLVEGINSAASADRRSAVDRELRAAYDDVARTVPGDLLPAFDLIWDQLQTFMPGTDIQVLNSNNDEQNQPRYSRRYNILIGGNKLARGVTIKNLLVTYYGRQAKRTNMDTMLQHARMYGYREKDLDVTRLFVTRDVEERFRLISESEQTLRDVIERYPNEEYYGILIGESLNPTRKNVLNPNNIGAYAGGSSCFPRMPPFLRTEMEQVTQLINQILDPIYPDSLEDPIPTAISRMIELVSLIKSDPRGGGLWRNDDIIIKALEYLRDEPRYGNAGYLVVRRRRRGIVRPENGIIRSVLGPGDLDLARSRERKYSPTLFMYREPGRAKDGWDDMPFWIPTIYFPDGRYALIFNLDKD